MSYRVLVVDDSPMIRKMMRRTLSLSRLELGAVLEAPDGQAALELLRREWVDVVLADIHMPVMSGTQLIETMRADEVLSTIPVVVVSAERSDAALDHLKSLGIYGHLTKPFTPEDVMHVVSDILARAEARPS